MPKAIWIFISFLLWTMIQHTHRQRKCGTAMMAILMRIQWYSFLMITKSKVSGFQCRWWTLLMIMPLISWWEKFRSIENASWYLDWPQKSRFLLPSWRPAHYPILKTTRSSSTYDHQSDLLILRQVDANSLEYAHQFTLKLQINDWSKHPYYNRILDLRSA